VPPLSFPLAEKSSRKPEVGQGRQRHWLGAQTPFADAPIARGECLAAPEAGSAAPNPTQDLLAMDRGGELPGRPRDGDM
jgi:hypothetical protein